MATPEGAFKQKLIKELEELFPGCMILKPDPTNLQGIPDLLVLYKDKWASLECKRSSKAHKRPNQAYYVELMDGMSFSAFIFPENEEEVLNALQRTFEP